MKSLFYISIVVILALLLYYYFKIVKARITFNFKLRDIKVGTINIADIKDDNAKLKIGVGIEIENKNKFSISFSDLYLWLYWNNNLIAKTSDIPEAKKKVYIPSNGKAYFVEPIDIYINKNTIGFLAELKLKKEVDIKYVVSLRILGLNIRYEDTYKYKQDEVA